MMKTPVLARACLTACIVGTLCWMAPAADAQEVIRFGFEGTTPVPADYDGDGILDVATYHDKSGTWHVFGSRDGFFTFQWGFPGTVPLPADYACGGWSRRSLGRVLCRRLGRLLVSAGRGGAFAGG